jgi:hypothetical protein
MVLSSGAADAMAARLAQWASRDGGAADVAAAAAWAAAAPAPPPKPPAWLRLRAPPQQATPPPPANASAGWMGLSLWSADDRPDGACA